MTGVPGFRTEAASATVETLATKSSVAEMPTMNVVIVGHVDHGKSTVVGRLLHDTGTLPRSRIEQVRRNCERAGKPFEYAFLIDALRDEQAQGITIDAARVFFRSARRNYIIIDAPGHIEFLKNMISGASRAEAAVLVIDAQEGVRENSRRHAYMTAMLGIRQLLVVVNKMDLVAYDQAVFIAIQQEYAAFLEKINLSSHGFIPVSGRYGDNLITVSRRTPWYCGKSVIDEIDTLESVSPKVEQAFRLPVQDVYKFPIRGDDSRIIAGTITAGSVAVGDMVEVLPSRKRSRVQSIEGVDVLPACKAAAGAAIGITLAEQLYVRPGELMYRVSEATPQVGTTFRANLFWLNRNPLVIGRSYLLKVATARVAVHVKEIVQVIEAATLERVSAKEYVGRHEVAECVLEVHKPIAFDLVADAGPTATGRFVLVDRYEIVGGGIITEYISDFSRSLLEHVKRRDYARMYGSITPEERVERYGQRSQLLVLTGSDNTMLINVARLVELNLFNSGNNSYYFGLTNLAGGLDTDLSGAEQLSVGETREESIRQLGEVSHFLTDAGQIVITVVTDLDVYEAEILRILNLPKEILIVCIGIDRHGLDADLVLSAKTEPALAVAAVCRTLCAEQEKKSR